MLDKDELSQSYSTHFLDKVVMLDKDECPSLNQPISWIRW